MKFGDKCWLRRGSISPREGIGGARFVAVRLLFMRGHQAYCELLEDDPRAHAGWDTNRTGEKQWWTISSLYPWTEERPIATEKNYLRGIAMKGFTLIEILIIVAIVVLVAVIAFSGIRSTDVAFALSESKDIKVIVDPKTGEASECIRPWVFSDWRCRSMNISKKSAEKE